ncbi:3-oxoadipate enol-lactonase [Enterovirga sp. CN4-39]|uniref:3-oxoadipate enol-lactonase n=1 Tax=Enterovirga sp. CN4-39 TaxID=3400910 RepID=UPI003C1166FF
MPYIEIQGESFHVQIDGAEGNPVLLLSNSLSSDMTMWEDQLPTWAERFRVVRYDQRGHGKSVVSPGPYSIAQLGRDAIAVLDALGIEKAHWCGLSLGGMVGMWVLTHAGHRIDRAVLANTAARMAPPDLWNGRMRLARSGGMEATVEPTITRWFPQEFRERAPATMDRMRAMVRRTPLDGYLASCSAIRDMDQRTAIAAIANPVLVVIGSKDPATKPADGELIHQAIAGSEVAYLDAAHISNVEQPEAFGKLVLEFLSRA